MEPFECIVVGAGPGGYTAAIRAAQLGLKTALVERGPSLGGTCLNVGCIPTKALLESTSLLHEARNHFADHGISARGIKADLDRMMTRKDRVVEAMTGGLRLLMKKNKITVVQGKGTLVGPGKVRVEGRARAVDLETRRVILALGSRPVELPGLPFDGEFIVSSTEALAFPAVPRRLVVVGAGAVGLELGSIWNRLGSRVRVVELLPGVTPFADRQAAKALERALAAQGLEFFFESRVLATKKENGAVSVAVALKDGKKKRFRCDKLLVAVGRRPASGDAGLEEAGVALDEAGRVMVDDALRTNLPGVFAVGDLVRGPMLAHKAMEEGVAAAESAAGRPGLVNYHAIPSVVYTEPELAQVGLTEEQVREQGVPFKAGRSYFQANGRARCLGGNGEGFVKILAHKETDRVLGVHMVGPRVSELIAEAVCALEFQASAEDLARTCHAHPTLAEVIKEAALAVDRRALHG